MAHGRAFTIYLAPFPFPVAVGSIQLGILSASTLRELRNTLKFESSLVLTPTYHRPALPVSTGSVLGDIRMRSISGAIRGLQRL